MIVETEHGHYGFAVDQVLGDHQTVIKNLGNLYRDVTEVSGATILGDGNVALILDPHRLVQSAIRAVSQSARGARQGAPRRAGPHEQAGGSSEFTSKENKHGQEIE